MSRRIDARLGAYARSMRKEPGEPEQRLWACLRSSQTGHKFRRQAVIAPYIVDFLCPFNGFVIEVDGDTHEAEKDRQRDDHLNGLGYTIMRFSNSDVMTNIEGVVAAIVEQAGQLPERRWSTHPNPSLGREGLFE